MLSDNYVVLVQTAKTIWVGRINLARDDRYIILRNARILEVDDDIRIVDIYHLADNEAGLKKFCNISNPVPWVHLLDASVIVPCKDFAIPIEMS